MDSHLPRPERIWLPIVVTTLLAIYLPGVANLPVFDDHYLTDGALFSLYQSAGLRERWLSYSSFVWVRDLLGEGWWKQRLVNLAIHIGVVVALWRFYATLLRSIEPPADQEPGATPYWRSPALGLAVGVFALNPVAVYAVAYLIQRSILLATLFALLSLTCVAHAAAGRGWGWLTGALLAYALAVLSKEHAILLPLAAVPLYIVVARPSGKRLAILGSVGAASILAAAALLSFRYGEILGKPFDEFSRIYLAQLARLDPDALRLAWPLSVMNQAWLFFEYAFRWVVPWSGLMSINLRPPFPIRFMTFPQFLGIAGYLAVLAGGAWLVIRHRDWKALVGVSLLLPAVLFATEFVTVWVQDPFVLYRSYLWAIGLPGLVFVLAHGAPARLLLAIGVSLAALFAWQGWERVQSLSTPERAWTDAIAKLPKDPRSVGRWFPYLNRGADYVERDDLKAAMRDFEISAALGDQGMGTFNMGAVLASAGRHPQALAAFDLAKRQGYDLYNLPFQRGVSLAALGRHAEALKQFEDTRKLDPPSPTRELVWFGLGKSALQAGRPGDAVEPLEKLLAVQPRNTEARYLLGLAWIGRGEAARALAALDALVAEDPKGPVFYARALAHHALKHKAEALADIERALAAEPTNPTLDQWRSRIQAMP